MKRLIIGGLAILLSILLNTKCSNFSPLALSHIKHSNPAHPNIILIISDDQAWNEYGYTEHPHIQTPTIDKLAAEGTTYMQGFNSESVCKPSLRTLLTGLHTHQWNDELDRLASRGIVFEQGREILAFNTLPALLAKKGYVSFQAGKYWDGVYQDGGFTEGMTKEFFPNSQMPGITGNNGLDLIRNGGIDPVLDFIDNNADRPFFVWFAPMVPHLPHNPPQKYLDLYTGTNTTDIERNYYAMISWLDDSIARLIDHLEQRGLRKNTLIVFLADNGWQHFKNLYPLSQWRNGLGGAKGKASFYELGFRTPIIFNWPEHIKAGAINDYFVTTPDVWATILKFAHAKVPQGRDAINLMKPKNRFRESIALNSRWGDILVTNEWWAVWPILPGKRHLFHRTIDPEQTMNFASLFPDTMIELRIQYFLEINKRNALLLNTKKKIK